MFNDGDKDTRERASTDCLFSRGTPLHWDTCVVQQRASLDNGDFVMGTSVSLERNVILQLTPVLIDFCLVWGI